jgi:hypothetical protein
MVIKRMPSFGAVLLKEILCGLRNEATCMQLVPETALYTGMAMQGMSKMASFVVESPSQIFST